MGGPPCLEVREPRGASQGTPGSEQEADLGVGWGAVSKDSHSERRNPEREHTRWLHLGRKESPSG